MIDFLDNGFDILIVGFGGNGHHATARTIHDAGTDTIGITFVFTDVRHQSATEITSKKSNHRTSLEKVGMQTIHHKATHLEGALQGIRLFYEYSFLGGRLRVNQHQWRHLTGFAPRSIAQALFDATFDFGSDFTRHIDRTVT